MINRRRADREMGLHRIIYSKPGYLIRRLQQRAVAVFLDETAPFGITPLQYGALAAVRAHPGIDQLRLGNAIGHDRTTIAGTVLRLERKGLLRRETDPADRRSKVLSLTRAGERVLTQMFPHTERAQDRMLEALKPRERRLFVEMLVRLTEREPQT